MCIAWQQFPPCTIPDDDAQLRRWLGNPRTWKKCRNQVLSAWKRDGDRWIQEGLLRQWEKQQKTKKSRQNAAKARWKPDANAVQMDMQKECSSTSSASSTPVASKKPPPSPPKGKKLKRKDYPKDFEEFMDAYPNVQGNAKGLTHDYWQRLLDEGIPAEDLLCCAQNYARNVRVSRTKFITRSQNFLSPVKGIWDGHLTYVEPEGIGEFVKVAKRADYDFPEELRHWMARNRGRLNNRDNAKGELRAFYKKEFGKDLPDGAFENFCLDDLGYGGYLNS
jgi:uncharacterized protein YdaU (DUF1376 family)